MFQQVGGNATGMDCEGMDGVAQQIGAKCSEIESIKQELENQMASTAWSGNDAKTFESNWQSEAHNAFQNLISVLDGQQTTLKKNIQQQRDAAAS